jgi:hypothetical protein
MTVGAQRQVDAGEDILQVQVVGIVEGAVQQGFGDLEAEEIVVRLGSVVAARNLQNIEPEFHPDVRRC